MSAARPVYFGGDDAHFAVVGHSVATTGLVIAPILLYLVALRVGKH